MSPQQALEILELRDQLQDAQDAISEAHSNSAGLKEHNRQLEAQILRLEQQLADAVRCPPLFPPSGPRCQTYHVSTNLSCIKMLCVSSVTTSRAL